MNVEHIATNALASILFAILGFFLLFLGFKVLDWLTPANLSNKIFEEGNLAAAIAVGAFVLGLAIIIHAAIS